MTKAILKLKQEDLKLTSLLFISLIIITSQICVSLATTHRHGHLAREPDSQSLGVGSASRQDEENTVSDYLDETIRKKLEQRFLQLLDLKKLPEVDSRRGSGESREKVPLYLEKLVRLAVDVGRVTDVKSEHDNDNDNYVIGLLPDEVRYRPSQRRWKFPLKSLYDTRHPLEKIELAIRRHPHPTREQAARSSPRHRPSRPSSESRHSNVNINRRSEISEHSGNSRDKNIHQSHLRVYLIVKDSGLDDVYKVEVMSKDRTSWDRIPLEFDRYQLSTVGEGRGGRSVDWVERGWAGRDASLVVVEDFENNNDINIEEEMESAVNERNENIVLNSRGSVRNSGIRRDINYDDDDDDDDDDVRSQTNNQLFMAYSNSISASKNISRVNIDLASRVTSNDDDTTQHQHYNRDNDDDDDDDDDDVNEDVVLVGYDRAAYSKLFPALQALKRNHRGHSRHRRSATPLHTDSLDTNPFVRVRRVSRLRRHQAEDEISSSDRVRAPVRVSVSRRSVAETPGSTHRPRRDSACSLNRWYLDFSVLGWNDWIKYPKGYHANFCSGSCPTPSETSESLSMTNHAFVKELYILAHEPGEGARNGTTQDSDGRMARVSDTLTLPRACCVPIRLSAMNILYTNDTGQFIMREMKEMIADGCGCL